MAAPADAFLRAGLTGSARYIPMRGLACASALPVSMMPSKDSMNPYCHYQVEYLLDGDIALLRGTASGCSTSARYGRTRITR